MTLELVPERSQQRAQKWLCRVDDDRAFAYARGHDYIRASDHELWAHLSDGRLLSARSGEPLAYSVGAVYYDAVTNEPLYYVPA